jgi:hypothetical protein
VDQEEATQTEPHGSVYLETTKNWVNWILKWHMPSKMMFVGFFAFCIIGVIVSSARIFLETSK